MNLKEADCEGGKWVKTDLACVQQQAMVLSVLNVEASRLSVVIKFN